MTPNHSPDRRDPMNVTKPDLKQLTPEQRRELNRLAITEWRQLHAQHINKTKAQGKP